MFSSIAIIGTGSVGATTAYTCLMNNLTAKIMLVDTNQMNCRGEVLDLADALSFSRSSKVEQTDLKKAGTADIIIITAGKAQKEGQSRSELLKINESIIKQIIQGLTPINQNAILIIVTNPVDTLTWHAQQMNVLPKNRVIGSGTLLDSQRLRNIIAQKLCIAEQSIEAYVVGEHGDNQVALLSSAQIAGRPLSDFINCTEFEKIAEQTKKKVYEIIACKGSTRYGVASCITHTCQSILYNQKRVIPISSYIKQYDVCMSMPTVIGSKGIEQIIIPSMSSHEQNLLNQSVNKLKKMQK